MAFDLNLYVFPKNPDSTKRPDENNIGITIGCTLKSPCSVINPTIRLQWNNSPVSYNYAYIPMFGRFYFVDNWSYVNGLWEAALSVDVMATYKDEIGASEQYVLRCSNTYDTNVIDMMYPAKAGCDVYERQFENPFTPVFSDGTFVLGVINSDSSTAGVGAVSYYVFTPSQFSTFKNLLLGSIDWASEGVGEISSDLTKLLFNPFQYIASCVWFPFAISGTYTSSLPYGWWTLPCGCSRLPASATWSLGGSVSVPKHPQVSRGAYLNNSPFSEYKFDWPCFGSFPINPQYLYNVPNFAYTLAIDLITGKAVVELRAHNSDLTINRLVHQANTQIGVPIQLAQIGVDYLGASSGGITSVAKAIGGAIYGAVTGNGTASIGDGVENAFSQVMTTGSNGSASTYLFPPVLQAKFLTVVSEDNERHGKPLSQVKTISTIPGYILTLGAQIELECTSTETERVKTIMDGGFYYE